MRGVSAVKVSPGVVTVDDAQIAGAETSSMKQTIDLKEFIDTLLEWIDAQNRAVSYFGL